MKKLLIISILLTMNYIQAAERSEEIGFLFDKRYAMQDYQKKYEREQYAVIKETFPGVKKVIFDILLPENTEKINQFKRIYISNAYPLFSEPQLTGLKKYAENGGLIITSSGLCMLDRNGDFKHNQGDVLLRRSGGIAGVIKFSSVKIESMKVEMACPLTKGLEEEKVIPVDWHAGRTHNVSAEVIVSGDAIFESKVKFRNMPIVTYRKIDKGAIIFLDYPGVKQIFLKNSLAPLTLEWLVDTE